MNYIRYALLLSAFTVGIRASTHWMVTENGLIQPRLNSPFEMTYPYDLLAFLNQDTRWDNIINLYHDLYQRKEVVRQLWAVLERETDVGAQLAVDKNCLKAGPLNLLDWYASLLEDGRSRNIAEEDFKLYNPYYGQDTDVPDCKKISSLTFSMFAFEHLEAMSQRENLTANPELSLPEQVSPIMNIDQFGHWVAGALRQNSSSWLHYNMASLYWRVRGNAPKAMECSRRAVHYAPRQFKDISLLSMGTIFHRSKRTDDAIVVLGAAVDHDQQYPVNHFVLANAFAVSGDFNNSIRHFDLCLKMNPKFDLAKKHKYGVLCHRALLEKMEVVQVSLDKLRQELVEYSQRETHWLKSQASFLRNMKHNEEFDYRNVEKNCEKMSQLTGLNIKELKKEGDKNSLIQYFLDGPMYNDKWLSEKGVHAVESAYSLQRLVKHIEKHADMVSDMVTTTDQLTVTDAQIKQEIGPMPEFTDIVGRGKVAFDSMDYEYSRTDNRPTPSDKKSSTAVENEHFEFEGGIVLYPPTMKVSRNMEDFDTDPEWPSTKFCKDSDSKFPKNLDIVYPVFMPFENKGIRLKSLLNEMIGVPAETEHELPWHPPACPHDKDSAAFTQRRSHKSHTPTEVAPATHLRLKLLEYVGGGSAEPAKRMQDAEIGQRIYAAMQMELAPRWLLHTLASLYWRVRGNAAPALGCLLGAARTAPARHRDLVMTSLASLYLEMGYFDEALAAAEDAFRVSLYEPATNFILAELNMIKKHRNTQLFHLKQVLRVEPRFMGGLVRRILSGWACHIQQLSQQQHEFSEGDICTQVEPGLSMVCEKDGTNCHISNLQCIHTRERNAGSTLIRMLELKGNDIHQSSALDDSFFDEFIDNMPSRRNDYIGHQSNYGNLRKSLQAVLHGCGARGCRSIQAEDLELQEEDCTFQHLQLGYWLHIINFKQLLTDANLRLPLEIISTPPSQKNMIPDCQLNKDVKPDFFMDRLAVADAEDWQPVLGLMHQFAETFNYFDYVTLGAKISKYVEARPKDWLAALTAGWWCGAGGYGHCALRCLLHATALAPDPTAKEAMLSIIALLHMQSKLEDAKDIAYLMFYMSPKSKLEAFLVAVSHTYLLEYEQAVWMYRYALTFDDKFLPAKACLHATMCLMIFGEAAKTKPNSD